MFIADTKLGDELVGVIVEQSRCGPVVTGVVSFDEPQLYVVYEPPPLNVISHR